MLGHVYHFYSCFARLEIYKTNEVLSQTVSTLPSGSTYISTCEKLMFLCIRTRMIRIYIFIINKRVIKLVILWLTYLDNDK